MQVMLGLVLCCSVRGGKAEGQLRFCRPASSPLGGQCFCETVTTCNISTVEWDKPVDKPVITRVCGPQLLCIEHIAPKLGNQNVH